MESQSRDWIYLLPGGDTAGNMKEGWEKMSKRAGHSFSSESFRSLVKKGVIKKISKLEKRITPRSDANNTTKSGR